MNDEKHPFKFTHWAAFRDPLQRVMVKRLVSSPVVIVSKSKGPQSEASSKPKGKLLSRKVRVLAIRWPDDDIHAILVAAQYSQRWLAVLAAQLPEGCLEFS